MLLGLRSLYEDFPVTSSYPMTSFWVAPYSGAPWAEHDSVTGAVVGSSGGRSLARTSGILAPTVGTALATGRTSAYFTSSAIEPIDPATLTMSGLWRASYTGAPWNGTTSLGASGSRNLVHTTNDPLVGTAVNGFTPASYDQGAIPGSRQLVDTTDTMADLLSVTAYTIIALFKPKTAFTATGTITDSPCVLTDFGGVVGLAYDSNGVTLFHDDGTYKAIVSTLATGSYALLMAYYDSVNLNLRINNGNWVTPVAAGTLLSIANSIRSGTNWAASNFLDMDALEIWTAQSALSRATLDQLATGIQAKYPSLSLGF